jgi:hypothetical protein
MSRFRFLLRLHHLALIAPIVLTLLPPRALGAQRADALQSLAVASHPLLALPPDSDASRFAVHMTPIAPDAPARPAVDDEGGSSIAGTVLRAVVGVGAGALVGGWLGYFGAQVFRSDWDKATSEQKTAARQSYTTAGLGLGGLLGYLARPKPHAPSRLPQPFNIPARTGRQLFANAELRRSIATNALEAVELGRPEWIKPQKDDDAKAGAPRTGPVESTSLVVYVGEEKVGGIEMLREISIPEVTELRYFDARDARRRWGAEHRYGAIEVVPAGTASSAAAPMTPASVPAK